MKTYVKGIKILCTEYFKNFLKFSFINSANCAANSNIPQSKNLCCNDSKL